MLDLNYHIILSVTFPRQPYHILLKVTGLGLINLTERHSDS